MPHKTTNPLNLLAVTAVCLLCLAGCDVVEQELGIEDPVAKAVGGACRQSGRAIEDCYAIYSWLPKSSIYDGWRDMDGYMRENKLETVEPQLPPVPAPGTRRAPSAAKSAK